jgi:hypothetical protein
MVACYPSFLLNFAQLETRSRSSSLNQSGLSRITSMVKSKSRCRQEAHERGRSRAAERPVRPQGCAGTHPQRQRERVHRQVCPGVAGASWCEDVIHRAGFAVGERLRGKLLSSCSGTSCWQGKRSTHCSRQRCLSSGGGSTTTPSGRTVPLGIASWLPRRGSPCAVASATPPQPHRAGLLESKTLT